MYIIEDYNLIVLFSLTGLREMHFGIPLLIVYQVLLRPVSSFVLRIRPAAAISSTPQLCPFAAITRTCRRGCHYAFMALVLPWAQVF